MKFSSKLSLCAVVVLTVAGIGSGERAAYAQSSGSQGAAQQTQGPEKKKSGFFRRLFSRDKKKSETPAPAASSGQQSAGAAQPQQFQRPQPYTAQPNGKTDVQRLLEQRYQAEGRPMPPLTMRELQVEQEAMFPEFMQAQQQLQQSYAQQLQQQSRQPPQNANNSGAYSQTQSEPQYPNVSSFPPQKEEKKKKGGFRKFLSRLNPFRRDDKEEQPEQPQQPVIAEPTLQQYAQQPVPQQPAGLPFQRPAQQPYSQPGMQAPPIPQQYVQQPYAGQQPGGQYPSNPLAIPQTPTHPPFPSPTGRPDVNVVIKQPQQMPITQFDSARGSDAQPIMSAEEEGLDEDLNLFAEEELPSLEDVELTESQVPATDEGFRPTQQPNFEAPVEETPQMAENESSPFTGKTLGGDEGALPKLQPVPQRNNYIHLDQLSAEIDSEELRREKRRLLLLSRPEQKGLKGFCPVTLKKDRDLVDAKPEFQVTYHAKIYQLSSAEAMEEFKKSPSDYAPARGGIDMVKYTMGKGEEEGTLEFAAWYRGRLYLFASAQTYDAFMSQPSKFATKDSEQAAVEEEAAEPPAAAEYPTAEDAAGDSEASFPESQTEPVETEDDSSVPQIEE